MGRYLMIKGQEAPQGAAKAQEPHEKPRNQFVQGSAVKQPAHEAPPLTQGSLEIWPAEVPGPELASKILTGQTAAGPWAAPTQRLLAQLSEIETIAVYGRPSPVDLTPLRNAVLTRWRLIVALDLKPPPGTPIDGTTLEGLLTEVDVVLASIQGQVAGNEPISAAMAGARGALARDAVALSEIAADEAHRVANAAVEAKSTKKYQHVARLVSVSSQTARVAVRSKAFLAMMIMAVIGTGAYHAYHFLSPPPPPLAAANLPPDLPPGMLGFKDDVRGVTVLQVLDKGHLPDPVVLQRLKAKAETAGKVFHQVAPGEYIIAPPAMKIPDMPSPPSEPKR